MKKFFYIIIGFFFLMACSSVGRMAPDFVSYDTNGKEVFLSDFRGKLVYIDFWATWCPHCIYEIPYFEKLNEQYHGKEIVFMGVSVDSDKAEEKWKKMIKEKTLKGVQVRVRGGVQSELYKKTYSLGGLPTYILIDRQGKIISCEAPRPSSESRIKNLIDKHL